VARKTLVASYPAKRIVKQLGGLTKKNRGHLNAEARNLQAQIKASGDVPVDTGLLTRSVKVEFVGGKNPRMDVRTVDYGLYQHEGTSHGVPATKFSVPTIKGGRRDWEAAVRQRAKGEGR